MVFFIENQVGIAAFQLIGVKNNTCYTYDINSNTNYNSHAENRS